MLCVVATAYAGGQAEPRLAQADALIADQRYADALKLLAAIQKDNPDLRDATASRMALIRAKMQQFNGVLSALSDAKAGGDVESMQKLLGELQKINPTQSVDVNRTMVALVGFLKLMDSAAASLAAGKPAQALATYLLPLTDPQKAGFDMQRSDFLAAGYGDIITAIITNLAQKTQNATSQVVQDSADLAGVPNALAAFLAGPINSDSPAGFDAVAAPVVRAAQAEGTLRSAYSSIAEMGRTISGSTAKGKMDPYVQYLLWLIGGRAGKTEGILYALNHLWTNTATSLAQTTSTNALSVLQAGRTLFSDGSLDQASKVLTDASYRLTLTAKAAAIASAQIQTSAATGWSLAVSDAAGAQSLIAMSLGAQEDAAEIGGYLTLISFKKELAAMPAVSSGAVVDPSTAAAETAQLEAGRSRLAQRMADAGGQQTAWLSRGSDWEKLAGLGATVASLASSARKMAGLFAAFAANELQQKDLGYALRLAFIGGSDFQRRLDASIAQRKQAEDFMNGTKNGVAGGTNQELHPETALPIFKTAALDLDALIADVSALETKLAAERPYVVSNAAFVSLVQGSGQRTGYDGILKDAQAERAGLDTLQATALQQIDTAAVASRQGDSAFNQAQSALGKNDPTGAVLFLDQAVSLYQKSLASAFTVHAQQRVDVDQGALSATIDNLMNTLAIDKANKAIANINQLVASKAFLKASDALSTAENDWNSSHTETYKPFDAIKESIQNALALSLGRDISPLDPKAQYVNGFLDSAQKNLNAGRLALAKQNVNDALAAAPNYGKAKVLLLQIQKQTDPKAFDTAAAQQIALYMANARDATNKQGQSDAYNALLDYSTLDPKFAAQLKSTIQELEYELGIVARPASAAQKAQANDLAAQAVAQAQLGTVEGYAAAFDLINRALKIDPSNAAARNANNLVASKEASAAITQLSIADQQRYNQAYSLYTKGAYQDALDIVNAIWNDTRSPRNKTYGPLQRLKSRIENKLS